MADLCASSAEPIVGPVYSMFFLGELQISNFVCLWRREIN